MRELVSLSVGVGGFVEESGEISPGHSSTLRSALTGLVNGSVQRFHAHRWGGVGKLCYLILC